MQQLHFEAPLNQLSFGNVSYNFLREFWRLGIDLAYFPTGGNINIESFDKIDPKLLEYIKESAYKRHHKLDKNAPTLKLWHINGAENRVAPKQYLYTFYECDSPTPEEIAIVKSQEHVFFSSTDSCEHFRNAGCENVSFVPIGFDEDFKKTNKKYFGDDVIHFGLVGKFEKRKNTDLIIRTWLELFGNNPKFQLTCLVNNPFFSPEDFQKILGNTLQGKHWTNINFLPWLKTNSEVNELYSAVDIDLSGLSGAEGRGLPSYMTTALGKWSIVSNCTAHKDWATKDNCILVEPEGRESNVDGIFFRPNSPFNQGNFYKISRETITEAMKESVKCAKTPNPNGELLRQQTYQSTISQILNKINKS